VEAAQAPNPVKSSPESLARAKKWWTLDCEMCHGNNGDGTGETAKDMKLKMADFTDPATLRSHRWRDLLHHQEWPQRYAGRRSAREDRRKLGPGQLRALVREKEGRGGKAALRTTEGGRPSCALPERDEGLSFSWEERQLVSRTN